MSQVREIIVLIILYQLQFQRLLLLTPSNIEEWLRGLQLEAPFEHYKVMKYERYVFYITEFYCAYPNTYLILF